MLSNKNAHIERYAEDFKRPRFSARLKPTADDETTTIRAKEEEEKAQERTKAPVRIQAHEKEDRGKRVSLFEWFSN